MTKRIDEDQNEKEIGLQLDGDFDSFPVTIKLNGKEEKFMMRELSGEARDRYLQDLGSRMRTDKDGKPAGMRDYKNLQATLLSLGLFHSDGKPVDIKTIQKWPARVQKQLHEKLTQMSGLDDDAEDDAKND
jgi:hypothetical protein